MKSSFILPLVLSAQTDVLAAKAAPADDIWPVSWFLARSSHWHSLKTGSGRGQTHIDRPLDDIHLVFAIGILWRHSGVGIHNNSPTPGSWVGCHRRHFEPLENLPRNPSGCI